MHFPSLKRKAWRVAASGGLIGSAAVVAPLVTTGGSSPAWAGATITSTGLAPGQVKHVWLIILENKSFDASFTGLNQNSYLWKTLPSQGVLLKNYFGTGHFSLDNYTSMVAGQGPMPADQNDCPQYANATGSVLSDGSPDSGASGVTDNGQFKEAGSPYASSTTEGTHGGTGCVYPSSVPTLFNQFDAAGVSWKGYAQDLGNPDATGPAHDVNSCGGPGNPAGTGVPNPGSANATDQYVPKHFPFPWFESLLSNPSDCTPSEIASLDSATNGLFHDLQSEATTPAFSWITPNNCSDAHDAICAGNNLSGSFDTNGNPVYQSPVPNPESTTPVNFTGGLYASDLFLKYYIPLIEQSPAFKDGGLIDVTFDEGNPPFANSSFNNANNPGNTLGAGVPPTAAGFAQSDAAGQSFIDGRNGLVTETNTEPTGPNTPLLQDSNGNQVFPGPGDNAFIDRPASLTGDPVNDPSYVRGGAGSTPGARTDGATAGVSGSAGSDFITDENITATDAGRAISGAGIPANACVGPVTDAGPRFDTVSSSAPGSTRPATNPGNKAFIGSFQVVDCTTNQVEPLTGSVTSVVLAAETAATDPLFTSTIATPGGGDTGSILISPLITPGTVSTVNYNHYSWLRTMEDIFNVSSGDNTAPIPGGVGSVSGGLDGLGHIGFAAQPGLKPFGPDVFNNTGHGESGQQHGPTEAAVHVGPAGRLD